MGALCVPGPLDALGLHGRTGDLVAVLRPAIVYQRNLVDLMEEPKCKALLPHCYVSA